MIVNAVVLLFIFKAGVVIESQPSSVTFLLIYVLTVITSLPALPILLMPSSTKISPGFGSNVPPGFIENTPELSVRPVAIVTF